ncbi:hypothetical protein JCM8115_003946 [Rhodotorula mucilaginosa]
MADDELDPSFLDLDLPAHASSSLSSLGAEFGGSSLDIGLDDSFEAQLGAGFGAAAATLGDELQFGGETLNGFEELDPARSVHLADSDNDDGDASSCDDDDGAVRTPSRQKRARIRPTPQHQSLAFELASVARPSQRERTLLSELGLEDDNNGKEAGTLDKSDVSESESEGSAGRRTARRGASASVRQRNGLARLDDDRDVSASPRRRSATNGRRAIPTSLEQDADRITLSNLRDVEQDAERERALEQNLDTAAANLSDSTRDILDFMSRLRIHVGASSSEPPNSTTISTATSTLPLDYRDRQAVVEDLCSAFLRSLQSSAAQRTEQQQDLTVLERELARTEVGWQHALGGLDPLPHDLFDDSAVHDHGNGSSQLAVHDSNGPTRQAWPRPRTDHSTATAGASITSELASLRSTTQSLLSLLASLAEQTQVQSALTSDAGRKLRALRTQLGMLKDEAAQVVRSEVFVEAYENARRTRVQEGTEESAAARARREVEAVQQRLESGWITAQKILTSCA